MLAACLAVCLAAQQGAASADWWDDMNTSGGAATPTQPVESTPTPSTSSPTPSSSTVYTPQTTQPTPAQVQERKERSVLAIALTNAVAGSLASVLSDLIGTLGRKLINWLTEPSAPAASSVAAKIARMSPTELAAKSVEYPMLGIGELVLLQDTSENAPVIANLPLETVAGEPLDKWGRYKVNRRFTLATNQVFAFKFTTNLPGLAKLYNVNARGETRLMSYYDALPFGDNRFPLRKGIRIHGEPGTEYLIIEFTPCIPSSARNDDRIAPWRGSLEFCKVEEVGQAGKSFSMPNRSAKDMTDHGFEVSNASAGAQQINVMGSLPGYQARETVRLVVEVIHNAQ